MWNQISSELNLLSINMHKIRFIIGIFLVLSACKQIENTKTEEQKIIETDIAFSDMSLEKGMNIAFANYAATDGVILRDNSNPIIGRDSIIKLFSEPDSLFKLSWHPDLVVVAKSADLGYTYGKWNLEINNNDTIHYSNGYYVSIWKKDENNNWKYVLDVGTSGLGQ